MLNVKFEASCVNSVYNTQIKPTAIIDKKDTLKVVSNMLNNFVIMLFVIVCWYKYSLSFDLCKKKNHLFAKMQIN